MVNSISCKSFKPFSVILVLSILLTGTVSATPRPDPDTPTTQVRVVIAGVSQELRTIARLNHTSEKALMKMNPGLTRENVTPGDALLVPQNPKLPVPAPDDKSEIGRGIRGRKQIALTFDCGWVEKKDLDRVLALLKEEKVDASFFLTGIFLKGNPKGAAKITKAGFPIYNHSQSHPHFTKLSDKNIQEELLAVERTVHTSTTLTTHPYWRPPFGDRDARVLRLTSDIGFRSIYWTLDSRDSASSPTLKPQQLVKRVCSDVFKRAKKDTDPLDGAIILFHTAAKATPDALRQIIPNLRQKGYKFVDLPTLMEPYPAKPKD